MAHLGYNLCMTSLAPSAEQSNFIAAISGAIGIGGSIVLRARAGTGKTASIKMACQALRAQNPGLRVLYVVFNKKNQVEAQEKLAPLGVTCLTLNSFGFRAVNRAARVQLDGNTGYLALDEAEKGVAKKDRLSSEVRSDAHKLLSLSRQLLAEGREGLVEIAQNFDLGPVSTSSASGEFDRFIDVCARAMAWLASDDRSIVDFDDQVWLPVFHGLHVDQYDVVMVDEAQDLSPAKLALARMAVKPGGLFVAVGDDRQAIYGFAGADPDSLPRIIRETEALVLPLTTTYRCPRLVVDLARRIVPDYVAHSSAPEGVVRDIALLTLTSELQPGDTVVSRTNAPLIGICLHLLAQGTAAKVLGRADVAEGLKKLVKKARTNDVGDLLGWVSEWADREVVKLQKAGRKESAIEAVYDRRDCLVALSDSCLTVDALLARIDRLFTDVQEGRIVLLTSTHRAKGLEWDRVFLLADTYRPSSASEDGGDPQEDNLLYVGITRAKRELVVVHGK